MKYDSIATVPLRGVVLYPGIDMSFEVGRKISIRALKHASEHGELVFCVAQKDTKLDFIESEDLYDCGVVAEVIQLRKGSDHQPYVAVVRPLFRAVRTGSFLDYDKRYFISFVETVEDVPCVSKTEESAYISSVISEITEYSDFLGLDIKDMPPEIFFPDSLSQQVYSVATNLIRDFQARQSILEENFAGRRAVNLIGYIRDLLRSAKLERSIDNEVQELIDRNQEEFFLREKLNAIKKRLHDDEEPFFEGDDVERYSEKISRLLISDEDKEELLRECSKLSMMQSSSADANVIRNYLDEVLKVPFGIFTAKAPVISEARKLLEKDHYGLEKVKERFLELIAVTKYTKEPGAQIICLVGPPGVGKTSIVRSVAQAMGREYVRMSLGGVHDEAEIRGHRKTYIGAMPGRIIAALKQAKCCDPVILMDEVDKLGSDWKGDPTSALLEVLDPAQNNSFRDNYIGIPVDLSKVVFVTTANDASRIPEPLFDRMEIIELPGYTFEEKLQIAVKHLLPKQRRLHSLTQSAMKLPDETIKYLITYYTKEAGVRRLEQLIASLCRKTLIHLEESGKRSCTVNIPRMKEWLGPEKFRDDEAMKKDSVGVVNGLAWTAAGGEMLQVEAITMPGTGKIELTGNLGDVMKESARAACSYIRSNSSVYNIPDEYFSKKDIHIHVPQGAVPKDGPSAGVTISTAVLSALTGRTFRHEVAMTGEISLTGRVMPIGGLREKSMAAYKNGIKKVIIPRENESDLYEVHETVKQNIEFFPVSNLEEVFSIGLNP